MCQRNQVYLKIFCTKSSQTSTYFFPFSITPSDSLPPPSSSFPFPSNEHSHQKGLCFLLNLEYLVFRHLISKKIQNYLLLIIASSVQFSSVTQSCPTLCNPMDCSTPGFPVHHQLLELMSNSCPSSRCCHPTISSSVVPFFSCLQSFPASGSFPVSQFFPSSGQSIGASASASVPSVNLHDWFPLGWTGWISLLSKGLSGVFSNTTVQKHQFFGTQLSL